MGEARYGSGLSTHPEPAVAVAEAIGTVLEAVGEAPDLAVVLASGSMCGHLSDAMEAVHALIQPTVALAGTAAGVLGGAEEIESGDAITVWAGRTGPVTPCRFEIIPGAAPVAAGLPADLADGSMLMVLADPYSFPVEALIGQLEADHPSVQLAGGLVSAGQNENQIWLDDTEFRDGAVGVVLPPGTANPVVSQGCRPIGRPWTVTGGEGQFIAELGGAPALDRVNEMVADLSPRDRLCASQGLHLGMVANEVSEQFERGDFLIRGVLGADRAKGSIAVGAEVIVGQTVQFQVRDAESAHDDLVELLPDDRSSGALVFTCNGRGSHMFAEPNHDAALVSEATNGGVAGMFCAGELGPIGTINAVHGFTATVLLFN